MIENSTRLDEKMKRLKTKLFVFEGEEVILTGRIAIKELPSGKQKELYEIKLNKEVQYANIKNKWVLITDLFEVQ